jgi:hypothetical protein
LITLLAVSSTLLSLSSPRFSLFIYPVSLFFFSPSLSLRFLTSLYIFLSDTLRDDRRLGCIIVNYNYKINFHERFQTFEKICVPKLFTFFRKNLNIREKEIMRFVSVYNFRENARSVFVTTLVPYDEVRGICFVR